MILNKIKNSQKLEQILLNFIDVLRINILMVDTQGKTVLVPKTNGCGFQGSARFGILQYLGSPQLLSKFQTEGQYLRSVDIFGLQNFALPVGLQGMDPVGYLIVGPVVLNKQLGQSEYKSIAEDLDINFSNFLELLSEIRVVSFNTLKSILDLLCELSQYALNMKDTEIPIQENKQKSLTSSIFLNLLELSMNLTQAENGSIMLLNNLTNELSVLTFKGIDLQKVQDVPMKLEDGIAGLAVQKKAPFVIKEDNPNRIRHLLKKPDLKCSLVMPIIKSNNEVIGVMNISTSEVKSRLATHSQEMLKTLTQITSGTFSNFL